MTHTDNTQPRTIHLLDIENLLATPFFAAQDVVHFKQFYATTDLYSDGDHIVIATSSSEGILEANAGWGSARYTFQRGENGADTALIEIIRGENLNERFDRAVIASGDGIFEKYVKDLCAAQVDVHVVSRRSALHTCFTRTDACVHLFTSEDYDLAA